MVDAMRVATSAGWKLRPDDISLDMLALHVAIDSEFWRALGKTAEWGKRCRACGLVCVNGECGGNTRWCPDIQEEWLYQQHRFIDHIASGEHADLYFEELFAERFGSGV
jgi:hypothetical protein